MSVRHIHKSEPTAPKADATGMSYGWSQSNPFNAIRRQDTLVANVGEVM